MKKLLFLLTLIMLTACSGKSEKYPTIQEKLTQMTSYRTKAELSYISNKGTTSYNTIISAKSDGKYRIDITSPQDYAGNVLMYDGKLVWHYNPHLADNKISANPPDKASRREIILFSFLENYAKSMETTVTTSKNEGSLSTVLEAELPGESPILAREKLYINNEEMLPEKLVIYDSENNERIVVKFDNFEYNQKLEDNIFNIS